MRTVAAYGVRPEAQLTEVLRLVDVWTAFDRGPVLEGATLGVDAGEIVAVVAGAGQGKTTLVRLASGTLTPDSGAVRVCGVELSPLKDRQLARVLASDVGVVIGTGPGLRMTVREYIEMAVGAPKDGWRRRWRRRDRRRMTTDALAVLEIGSCGELRWGELSDWQRVLVELAQAIVVRPRLLLLDDVADGFGLRQKQELANLLERYASDYGCGVLMAVSDYGAAARALRVWSVQRRKLRLIADHTATAHVDGEVIPLWPDEGGGEVPAARRDA